MKYSKSVVHVLGTSWMPSAPAAKEMTLNAHDVENCKDDDGRVTRESLELWLGSHEHDFQKVIDFWASIEVDGETVEIEWGREENGFAYGDLTDPEDAEGRGRNLAVEIWSDQDVSNPADEWGWRPFSFNRRHVSYCHPDELPDLEAELMDGRAFRLSCFEHGNCLWMLQGDAATGESQGVFGADFRWDGRSMAGVLAWEGDLGDLPESLEDRKKAAESFLEFYTHWCNGEGYGYTITDADTGGTLDTCSNYLGMDDVLAAVLDSDAVEDDDVITKATFADGTDILGEVQRARTARGKAGQEAIYAECEHTPPCLLADGTDTPCGRSASGETC